MGIPTLKVKMAAVQKAARPAWRLALARWAYNKSYFPQLGLMRDDTLYEDDDVKEAVRSLPRNLLDERAFRLSRAVQLSNKKEILPKEEWTKFDEDVKYLQPYLEEVKREKKEKSEWMKQ